MSPREKKLTTQEAEIKARETEKEKQARVGLYKLQAWQEIKDLFMDTIHRASDRTYNEEMNDQFEKQVKNPLIHRLDLIISETQSQLRKAEESPQELWLIVRAAQLVYMKIRSGEIQLSTYEYTPHQSLLVPCYPLLTTPEKGILLFIDKYGTLMDSYDYVYSQQNYNRVSLTGDGWASVLDFLLRVKADFTPEEWHSLIVNCQNIVKDYE